jgi:diguanylate cyclase (GGDEF)-like protein
MLRILSRSILLTLAIMAAGSVLSYPLSQAFGIAFYPYVLVMNLLVPVVVAFPLATFTFWQTEKLKETLRDLELANSLLIEKSNRDPLTGMYSREAFIDAFKVCRRRVEKGVLLMIDADFFKLINDTYGHLTGDDALRMIASSVLGAVRRGDIAGRIGGEEFAIFLPGTSVDEARIIAERIRRDVEVLSFIPVDKAHRLSVSIGGAEVVGDQGISSAMRLADLILYKAKSGGRYMAVIAAADELIAG